MRNVIELQQRGPWIWWIFKVELQGTRNPCFLSCRFWRGLMNKALGGGVELGVTLSGPGNPI